METSASGSQTNHDDSNLSLVSLNQLESYLECSICIALVCEPITISCGHSFCRVCLVKSLKKHKKKCPSCRAVCHVSAETAEENVMLKNICTSLFSKVYNERLIELQEEKASWATTLPIFYYNDCHFPGYNMGLHLFEPRYKLMMQRIVNTGRKFAFVPNFGTYTAKVGDVALVANLIDVQFLADGCVLLKAKLTERKTITEHYVEDGTQNLHFCSVEPLKDTIIPITDEIQTARTRELVLACHGILNGALNHSRREIEAEFGPPPLTEGNFANIEVFSLWMVSFTPLPARTKYRLLSSIDTLDRLETVVNAFIQRLGRHILPSSSSASSATSSATSAPAAVAATTTAANDGVNTSSNTTSANATAAGTTRARRMVRAHPSTAHTTTAEDNEVHPPVPLSEEEEGRGRDLAFWDNAIERAHNITSGASGPGLTRAQRRDIRGDVRELFNRITAPSTATAITGSSASGTRASSSSSSAMSATAENRNATAGDGNNQSIGEGGERENDEDEDEDDGDDSAVPSLAADSQSSDESTGGGVNARNGNNNMEEDEDEDEDEEEQNMSVSRFTDNILRSMGFPVDDDDDEGEDDDENDDEEEEEDVDDNDDGGNESMPELIHNPFDSDGDDDDDNDDDANQAIMVD